ncbi:glycosyl transferase family 8 [Brachyspira hyodysenteriae]|uniref:Glycosyl transferase family 8 n=1 Tax=Brachyspira hyodysenteriae ATCC 27164 TaxID=1266923 RepID=A0A3B6VUW8_BRAHO|nr:glycosyl transferase family 8 [Brachyspira hyodysenteriae ATCC 27164]TVL62977.1 glycosyl transferase family 8 [Brachyspira hyodysenteriae]TVL67096.1 glycosyl transferase family 8 [Brachyspira hyodysenteriae]TVL81522.1 glycosyl transferase family 8 [Brachyspira hyodysenteriae]TVL81861.1 glycosyl transferase family 8 [Brachyspira hyodysenteriae]
MKKLAVVLCSTSNQMFALGNTLIGLKKHFSMQENEYDIIIYTDVKINIKDENALKKIYPNIIINIFNFENKFTKSFLSSENVSYYSIMAYSRYEIFTFLNKYEQILYIDTDILIQKDIIQFTSMKDKNIYACKYKDILKDNKLKYSESFNSGMMLFNSNIENADKIYNELYRYSIESLNADEVVLNTVLAKFNVTFGYLDSRYNCFNVSDIESQKNAYIIHASGSNKFWDLENNDEWNENNKKWIELGGIKYDKELINKKKKLIEKLLWFIPSIKLRSKLKVKLGKKFGFRWTL